MKAFTYIAAAVTVVVAVSVGGIALTGAWSPRFIGGPSYASPAAVLFRIGCTDTQPVGDAVFCPPLSSQRPLDFEAMTFKQGLSPTDYLSAHPAEFANKEQAHRRRR